MRGIFYYYEHYNRLKNWCPNGDLNPDLHLSQVLLLTIELFGHLVFEMILVYLMRMTVLQGVEPRGCEYSQ